MVQAPGVQALAADMGWALQPRAYSDETAAIGISKIRGLGKIWHLHTCDLWTQEQTKRVLLGKILGCENPVDMFKKYVGQSIIATALRKMNCEFRDKVALDTMGLGDGDANTNRLTPIAIAVAQSPC